MDDMHLTVLTGAPGSGKTSVLDHVGASIVRVDEPAREILAEQRAAGGAGTPDQDPTLFLDLLLRRSIEKRRDADDSHEPVVFDRGVPDCVAYALVLGVESSQSLEASRRHRYGDEVLILPPWEEIYSTDDERTMSFADTIPFHEAIVEAYERTGYKLIEVPRGSAEERGTFVRTFVTRRARAPTTLGRTGGQHHPGTGPRARHRRPATP
jgi:predicted ATPase